MENTYEESEQSLLGIILSAFLLILGLVLDATHVSWFANTYVRYLWYIVAFIPVGKDVVQMALHSLWHREWMGEQVLMSVAANACWEGIEERRMGERKARECRDRRCC